MKSNILCDQINVYRNNFLNYGATPMGTFQNNTETQYLRFEKLLDCIDISRKFSIHDIGCGICDLHKFLKLKKVKHDYYGTEIVPEMIKYAKNKYPEIKIYHRDIMNKSTIKKCDYVVLSGTFNIPGNVHRKEWKRFCFKMIEKMYNSCNKAIVFNFLTTHKTFTDPDLFYLDPAEVLDFCLSKLSRFSNMQHHYALYEATVSVYKKDFIQTKYKPPAFAKYFTNQ